MRAVPRRAQPPQKATTCVLEGLGMPQSHGTAASGTLSRRGDGQREAPSSAAVGEVTPPLELIAGAARQLEAVRRN